MRKIDDTRVAARFVEGLTAQRLASTDLQLGADAATTIAKVGRFVTLDGRRNATRELFFH